MSHRFASDRPRTTGWRRAVLGTLGVVGVWVGLAAAGRLKGPALVGGGPLAESLLVSAGAAVVGVTAALVLPAVTRSPGNHGPGRKQDT